MIEQIKTVVYLLDTRNGAFGIHFQDDKLEDGEYDNWWLTEGNAGCDCNRSNFLYGYQNPEYRLECGAHVGENIIKVLAILDYETGDCLWEGDYLGRA